MELENNQENCQFYKILKILIMKLNEIGLNYRYTVKIIYVQYSTY